MKTSFTLKIFFEKLKKDEILLKEGFFNSKANIILSKESIDEILKTSFKPNSRKNWKLVERRFKVGRSSSLIVTILTLFNILL